MNTLSGTTTLTDFADARTPQGTRRQATWHELAEQLRVAPALMDGELQLRSDADPAAIKRAKPRARAWSPATFAGDRRASARIEAVRAVVLDVDHDAPPIEDLVARLSYAAVVATSPTHTSRAPRYRVIVPTQRPMTSQEYPRIARDLARRLDLAVDEGASFDPSRLWFTARFADVEPIVVERDGPLLPISPFAGVEGAPVDAAGRVAQKLARLRQLPVGEPAHAALLDLTTDAAANGVDVEDELVTICCREWEQPMPESEVRALCASARAKVPSVPRGGLRCLADVAAEHVSWLWRGYIPLGKLTILDGDPGLGKSQLTIDIIARLSRGDAMPDGSPGLSGPAASVLLAHEDGLADTIRPRLDAARADPSRVFAFAGDDVPSIPQGVERIKDLCRGAGAKLLVIDPLVAYLSEGVDAHKDSNVRRALTPLAVMADELGMAVMLVRHLKKAADATAVYRGGGSIGIIGAARSGLLVAKDPADENARVLASSKGNLHAPPPSRTFVIESAGSASRVRWTGMSSYSADALLAAGASPEGSEKGAARREAKDVLRQILAGGCRVPAEKGVYEDEGVRELVRAAGISWPTAKRAKAEMGVRSEKVACDAHGRPTEAAGFDRRYRWYWRLEGDHDPPKGITT